MSDTPKPPDDEEEGQPWKDGDERMPSGFASMSFSDLPPHLQEQLKHQKLQHEVHTAVQGLIDKQAGIVEAKLLPEFTLALQNDFRITNRDALFAQHAAQSILDHATTQIRRPTYWASSHALRYVAAMLLLEAETQEATAHLQEEKLPGTTSMVDSTELPSD